MPMVRRGDDHGVNVTARQEFAEIVVGPAAQVGSLTAAAGVSLVHRPGRRVAPLLDRVGHGDTLALG